MKLLLTGTNHILEREIPERWTADRIEAVPLSDAELDDAAGLSTLLSRHRPEAVIHCASMPDEEACCRDRARAFRGNALGAANLALACCRTGARLVFFSDFRVFSGRMDRAWRESDEPQPATVLGESLYSAERAIRTILPDRHLICRTSWLYGGMDGAVGMILQRLEEKPPLLRLAANVRGNPTSAAAVAAMLRELLSRPQLCGIFHLACENDASLYELALEVQRWTGGNQALEPEMERDPSRLGNACLENRALRVHGLPEMPDWRLALKRYFDAGPR